MALRYFPVRTDTVLVLLLLVWLGAAAYQNWWTEFVYRVALNRGDVMTALAHVIDNTPTPAALYMAGEARPADPKMAVIDCMIAPNPDRVIVNLPDDPRIVPLPPQHRGNAVLMLSPFQRELAPLVRHYYPEARTEIVYTSDEVPSLYTFALTAREVEQHRGLRVTYQSPTRTWSPREGSDVGSPPEDAEFPLAAAWRGQVWIDPPDRYRFRGLGATLRIDGQPTDGSAALMLPAGWHTLEASTTFRSPTDVAALEWRPTWRPEWTRIPRTFLDTHPDSHGLLGRYFDHVIDDAAPLPIPEAPGYATIDAVLSFDWFDEIDDPSPPFFAARPATMEWVGLVELPEGSDQTLRLDATTPTQVFLDGALVLSVSGNAETPPPQATVPGLSGTVPILVRTTLAADVHPGFWRLRLLWRDAGGGWTAFVRYHPPQNDAAAAE